MIALAAAILIAQISADGSGVDRSIPNSTPTWRWTKYEGKALLGWGIVNKDGYFESVRPHPPWPLFPDQRGEKSDVGETRPTAAPDSGDDGGVVPKPIGGDLPPFAVNGVITAKLDSGVTMRASDPESAADGRRILMEAKAEKAENCPDDPPEKVKLPLPSVEVAFPAEKVVLYVVAAGLLVFAGWIYKSSNTPK